MKTYVFFIFHTQINIKSKKCNIAVTLGLISILRNRYSSNTQININSKKCNTVVVLIFSQFTSMYMPKN